MSSHPEKRSGDECLVCFTPLGGGQGFAHVLHKGEMAKFCSLECMEIFQNNPESFLRRMKSAAAQPTVDLANDSKRAEATERRPHVA
jgi:hypothetical protein